MPSPSPHSQGFTLVESLVVSIIVGILAAIAAPSLLGMYYRAQLNHAQNQVQGAIQEAQRQAIRKSQTCKVQLSSTQVSNYSSDPCLMSDRTLPSNIKLASNMASEMSFNLRGGTSSARTLVLYVENNAIPDKKCIVVSLGIGLTRTGDYQGEVSQVKATQCSTR